MSCGMWPWVLERVVAVFWRTVVSWHKLPNTASQTKDWNPHQWELQISQCSIVHAFNISPFTETLFPDCNSVSVIHKTSDAKYSVTLLLFHHWQYLSPMVTFSWILYSGLRTYKFVVKKYWNQIHILDKLNHIQMIGTNIMMCYCTFLNVTVYSIVTWAVLQQECSCQIYIYWCLGGQNCMCTLNFARSQSYSNWAESIFRFHCQTEWAYISGWHTVCVQKGMI